MSSNSALTTAIDGTIDGAVVPVAPDPLPGLSRREKMPPGRLNNRKDLKGATTTTAPTPAPITGIEDDVTGVANSIVPAFTI